MIFISAFGTHYYLQSLVDSMHFGSPDGVCVFGTVNFDPSLLNAEDEQQACALSK